ncbi:MAG: short-chain dehydrogenase [Euryarchaeota archaeon]|nr:short-chain dehydrogenase [Euryarchaeota archaeon]
MSSKPLADLFKLDGKAALVTGGAGVIGSRICLGLAAHGANVAVVDLDLPAAKCLAEEINYEYGGKAKAVYCDVSDPASVNAMVDNVYGKFGKIDFLHNNAAAKSRDLRAFFSPFEQFTLECWREIMSVNLDGMFLVAQAVGKKMLDQAGGGSILQTASIYGIVGPDFGIYEGSEYLGHEISTPPAYSASKAGVIGLTKYLATYWSGKGIRVNALVPGGVESGQNENFQKRYGARTPLGRMADRDEIVGAVIFAASDASKYMSGQNLIVDGGWTAW